MKRFGDIFLAALLLLLVAPVMVVVAVAIRLGLGHAAIFRQTRIGYRGRRFTMYKFRTLQSAPGEPHRTNALGHFLRRTSMDELPQLFNVLRGEMSLVGPRPLVPSENDLFAPHFRDYARRHDVFPGITGLAQVSGLRGPATLEMMKARLAFDLHYAEHQTSLLDLRILLRTPWVLFD